MKNWVNRNFLFVLGALVGVIAGFLYWQEIGCASGNSLITSKPVNSSMYGAIMGSIFWFI